MTMAELPRFRGIDKRAFLDQRHLNGHAFQLLEEAILFCQRHLSTAARIPSYLVSGGCIVVTFPLRPESRPESELARGVLLAMNTFTTFSPDPIASMCRLTACREHKDVYFLR
jgi:hypothetical protein